MGALDGALAGLGLGKRDVVCRAERLHRFAGLGVPHAAARDQQGLFCRFDQRRDIRGLFGRGNDAGDLMDALCKEAVREIVALPFHVLAQGDAHRAGVRRIGQGAHGVQHGAHQVFGTGDAVPVAAYGLISVVGGDAQRVRLFKLLQHGVGLPGGKRIRREQQQRHVVDRCGGCRRDHVCGAGADGGRAGNDLSAVVHFGKRRGGVRHALLVLPLEHLQLPGVFIQRLPEPDHNAVPEHRKDPFHKFGFPAVKRDVLVVQELHKRLCGCHDCHIIQNSFQKN